MTRSLPPALAQRLQRALRSRGLWRPAVYGAINQVLPLGGGRSNHSLLLNCGQQWLVLRLDRLEPQRHGLDREAEYHIMTLAAEAKIAPRPRHVDSQQGVLVYDYVGALPAIAVAARSRQGTQRAKQQEQRGPAQPTIEQLAALLRAIHRLPAAGKRLNLSEVITRYTQQLAAAGAPCALSPALLRASTAHCAAISADTHEAVLCHNDLLPPNIVRHQGRWLALDWEYAACAPRCFDLAGCCSGRSAAQALQLQHAYLRRAATVSEQAALLSARVVHHCISLLWQQVSALDQQGHPPATPTGSPTGWPTGWPDVNTQAVSSAQMQHLYQLLQQAEAAWQAPRSITGSSVQA